MDWSIRMKLIIAGSRNFHLDISTIQNVIDILIPMDIEIEEVVSGTCTGVDQSGEAWAQFQNIPIKRFKANWSQGKIAGPMRNTEMAEYADALLVIWDGTSKGSLNMTTKMNKLEKPIYEVILRKN